MASSARSQALKLSRMADTSGSFASSFLPTRGEAQPDGVERGRQLMTEPRRKETRCAEFVLPDLNQPQRLNHILPARSAASQDVSDQITTDTMM